MDEQFRKNVKFLEDHFDSYMIPLKHKIMIQFSGVDAMIEEEFTSPENISEAMDRCTELENNPETDHYVVIAILDNIPFIAKTYSKPKDEN